MAEQGRVVRQRSIERLVVLYTGGTVVSIKMGCTASRQAHALSTEPLIALESISFVRRNDSISFPSEEEWSRSCNARSTGLNYSSQSRYIEISTNCDLHQCR